MRESPVIRRTSAATLAQLVHQLFENAEEEIAKNKEHDGEKGEAKAGDATSLATAVFEEFCVIASGKLGKQLALLGPGSDSGSSSGAGSSSEAAGSSDEVC